MRTRIVIAAMLAGLTWGTVFSQNVNRLKLDSLFTLLAEKDKAMGSVAISKNGSVVYRRTIGYRFVSESEKQPSTELTKYRIGSITKMFTATMVFQLMEEGKLTLNTPLDEYFPGVPNAKKITIRHLLNHRSGIHNFTNDPDYAVWMTHPKTHDEMLAIISDNKPDFEPDEKASYSNSNYVLLGYIVETISKRSYADNLKERITSKIGLPDTYIGGKTNTSKNESFSYLFNDTWKQMPECDMSIPGGAGAIVSTPGDLVKFIEALFSLKLVSQHSLAQMKTVTDGFGMGMVQFPFNGKKAYGHNGSIDCFAANVAYFPEDSVAVAYCTNGQAYPMNDILIGVLSVYFNEPYTLPAFTTITVQADELNMYLGIYASTQLPLKITITKDEAVLVAQATGQSSFRLDAVDKNKFKFDGAGILMEFNAGKNEMTLKQGGGTFLFTKEK
jgi:D-alanyl-D-alanine carboxypeptidase